jgi:hypothetical protein
VLPAKTGGTGHRQSHELGAGTAGEVVEVQTDVGATVLVENGSGDCVDVPSPCVRRIESAASTSAACTVDWSPEGMITVASLGVRADEIEGFVSPRGGVTPPQ